MRLMILCIFLFTSHFAIAWTLVNYPNMKGWKDRTLVLHLNPANCPSNIGTLLGSAIQLWGSVSSSALKLDYVTDSTATTAQALAGTAADRFVVICEPAYGIALGRDANLSLGVGSVLLDFYLQIERGFLILNVQPGALGDLNIQDENTAKMVVAHEIGHALGIGHSSHESALMYYSVGNKTNFVLSEDDENAMAYLYGRKEITGADELMGGCALVKTVIDNDRGGPMSKVLILMLLMSIPLFLARRYRRLVHV